jgi:uncharacterized protein YndB with AHSA1/START domain
MAKQRNIISDKLVIEKTGKPMEDWFKLLDSKGAQKLAHVQIFDLVGKTPGLKKLGLWNQNLFTTTYEWSRGIKARGQREKGFEISVSKTVSVPLGLLFQVWMDDSLRKKWLKEKITIGKSTESKSARITWSDGETSLSVDFYSKGKGKSQVVVQHMKIPDSIKAAELKEFWGIALEKLKSFLEEQ